VCTATLQIVICTSIYYFTAVLGCWMRGGGGRWRAGGGWLINVQDSPTTSERVTCQV